MHSRIALNAARRFLKYSLAPVEFNYDQLSISERSLVTKEEFEELVRFARSPEHPDVTDEDRKNYSYDIRVSPWYNDPSQWLKEGQRVRAKFRIFDLPNGSNGPDDWGWVSAEAGALGTVVHVEEGYWPTVKFDDGYATCVTDHEVEPV